MKRILTILALALSFASTAQNVPGATWVPSRYRWLGGMFNQLKLPAYADTSNVPTWAPWLSGDAMLDTSGGNAGTIYVRYGSPRKWHAVSGSGGSGGGISEWIAGFGLLQVNDSTGAVDTALIASRDRLYQQRDSLLALINLRMKYTDTASALSGYVRVGRFLDSLTAAQTRIQTKVAFTDTATMVSGYVRKNRNLAVGYGISGGGDLNANRTFTADTATLFPAVRATITSSSGGTTDLSGIRDTLLSPYDPRARATYKLDFANQDSLLIVGNSFDVGYNVGTDEGYTAGFGAKMGLTANNLASSGTGTYYTAGVVNNNQQTWNTKAMLVGGLAFNDVLTDSSAGTFSKIGQGYRSVLASVFAGQAIPASAMTASGTWTSYDGITKKGKAGATGALGGSSRYNNVSGSYLETTVTGSTAVVSYSNSIVGGFAGGEVDVSIDGTVYAHLVLNKTNSLQTEMPGAFIIPGLSNAAHTLRITNTTNNYVFIDYVGTLKNPGDCSPVIMVLTSKINATGYAAGATHQGSDRGFNRADDTIRTVVREFAGYPVRLVPVNYYMNTSTDLQSDSIHPNAQGHRKLLEAVSEEVIKNDVQAAGIGVLRGSVTPTIQKFEGLKAFNTGIQVTGTLASRYAGGGLELLYSSGSTIQSFNSTGSVYTPLTVTGSTLAFNIGASAALSFNSSLIGSTARGMLINQGLGNTSNTQIGTTGSAVTFVVDGTNNRVGIATSLPRQLFEVRGSQVTTGTMYYSGARVTDTTGYDIALIKRTDSSANRISWPVLSALMTASGTANANVGSAFRILQPTAQTMKTVSAAAPLAWDSTTANQLNVSIDTAGTARFKYVGLGITNTAGAGYSYLDIASAYGAHGQLRLYGGPDPTSPNGGSIWNNSNGHLSFAEASGDFIRLDNQNDIGTASDANYTIANNTYTDVVLAAVTTANRTLTFPTALTGTEFSVWNRNTGGFTWQVSGTVVDAAGAAITTLTNATVYKFRCFVAGTWTRSN